MCVCIRKLFLLAVVILRVTEINIINIWSQAGCQLWGWKDRHEWSVLPPRNGGPFNHETTNVICLIPLLERRFKCLPHAVFYCMEINMAVCISAVTSQLPGARGYTGGKVIFIDTENTLYVQCSVHAFATPYNRLCIFNVSWWITVLKF